MKKLLSIFLLFSVFCFLFSPAQGALNFSADTHRVQFGSPAASDSLTGFTKGGWVNVSTLSAGVSPYIIGKNDDPSFTAYLDFLIAGDNGRLHLSGGRATTEFNVQSASSEIAVNTWYFVAATGDRTSTTNTDFSLWKGTLTANVAEVSSYAVRQAGSGAANNTDSLNWQSGNTANNSTYYSFRGAIAYTFVANKRLSAGELQIIQWMPRCYKDASGNGIVHLWVYNNSTNVTDLCGNASNGTITGAAVSAHVPLGNYLGF